MLIEFVLLQNDFSNRNLFYSLHDYCCWVDDTTEEEEITIESTTLAPEEPFPYTDETKRPKRPVVEAIIERPDKKEERKSGSVTSSEDSDESEWESETTRRTKRPRSRKKCYSGYKCEYNEEIRRLICCGRDMELFPPPGLPMLPAPKPLIPRPFLPPIRPFGLLNDNNNVHGKQQLK
uniref:Uncharacterized protein n=1 Tax=Heterorhabditis bacteriophora TaxID=37862 RepID=A0A1I7XL75_HETBA